MMMVLRKHTRLIGFICGLYAVLYTDTVLAATDAHSKGMPQMDVTTYPRQIFWMAVCFTLMYLIMSKYALPQIGETLEKRDTIRKSNLDDAHTFSNEGRKIERAVKDDLADAQKAARDKLAETEERLSEKMTAESERFGKELQERIEAAEADINAAKSKALSQLSDMAAEIAAEMTGKIGGMQVAQADAMRTVQAIIAQKG